VHTKKAGGGPMLPAFLSMDVPSIHPGALPAPTAARSARGRLPPVAVMMSPVPISAELTSARVRARERIADRVGVVDGCEHGRCTNREQG
jgi:hypothetical protein